MIVPFDSFQLCLIHFVFGFLIIALHLLKHSYPHNRCVLELQFHVSSHTLAEHADHT